MNHWITQVRVNDDDTDNNLVSTWDHSKVNIFIYFESGKSYQKQHSAREICTPLMFVAYVKWQFVKFKDFSRYPLLLPLLASDALQNVPFCSGERGLQGHALLAAATPSPRQLCLASSHLLPSLLLIQKVRFVRENCIFLVPGRTSTRFTETAPFGFSRFQPAVLHEAGKTYFCTWY